MSVTSQAFLSILASGDVNYSESIPTTANAAGAGKIDMLALQGVDTTITVPVFTGIAPKGVFIQPPAANTQTLRLKGVAGDTGFLLHKTEPTYLALDPTTASFVLTAGGTINGLRLVWN